MPVRGVRGATVIPQDEPEVIRQAARELLQAMQAANPSMHSDDLASAIFTMTADLSAAFPAEAARVLGWERVPLMCMQEIPVPGSLPGCLRILLHWNTDLPQADIRHVYLHEAAGLRPDLPSINLPME